MTVIRIALAGASHPTLTFALTELRRYLARLSGRPVEIADASGASASDALVVSLFEHVPDELHRPVAADPRFDDAIVIQTQGGAGWIAGNSPRAVLLAVYRYLHALGCRWVRPGPGGEYVPGVDLDASGVILAEAPSYRHRGICIEGAVSVEHVCDLIDWMPKVGLSAYFIQFREGFTFFDRWYSHMGHPTRASAGFTVEQARELMARVVAEIQRRSLIYHAVGHGWTCEPFGMPGLGWEYPPAPLSPDAAQYLALVGGKRELWEGIPLNTSLCYSNPEVRRIMTDAVAEYAQQHPEVDLLHFWLADGLNNQCECVACARTRPSDFYVMMLNEIDRKLRALSIDTRIVFLAYMDLLWPPERERIENPDRFVLMFAPISRSYSRTFVGAQGAGGGDGALPPFERNRLTLPADVGENLAFLRAWQAQCRGMDSFDFDYHLMWDHYKDPANMQVARVLHDDLRQLHSVGLDGFNSCQVQRAFFPTGFPMALLGWTLWDKTRDFEELARDYFAAAFGPAGGDALAYLTTLTALFDPEYLRGEKPDLPEAAAARYASAGAAIAAFLPVIERNSASAEPCWAQSWRYLRHHAELTAPLAAALHERALGHASAARAAWDAVASLAWQKEDELHPVLDVYQYVRMCGRWFEPPMS